MVKIRRIYDTPDKRDGKRVLVDRLWPRGIKKEDAAVDLWLREIAPSNELRKWFGHDPERWQEFRRRYRKELEEKADMVRELRNEARKGTVTLLYSAKDTEHNNAVVLRELIAS
jgi:uncharacterized protein YeaO (DUF488 family)